MSRVGEEASQSRFKLWLMGLVAVWYLRASQLEFYKLLLREKNAFAECSRRWGKTTTILAFVLEQLKANPGWICRWCFPFKNQAYEVLLAEMSKIQQWAPESDRFIYTVSGSVFTHANGSKLYIRGVNEDRGESARGAAANIIVCDEYGFWVEPDYVVKEVLSPQLLGQEGQWLIKVSTPPRDLGHRYYEERKIAIAKGRFIQKTIYDNESLSQEELDKIIEEAGGIDSPSFRREYLCEPVSDPKSLIVPEFSDTENVVDDDYPRPEFFDSYVGGDSGADDNTVLLFGYYDFLKDETIIEDEIVLNGATSAVIIALAKIKELSLWNFEPAVDYEGLAKRVLSSGENSESENAISEVTKIFGVATKKAYLRSYDASKQLIYDIRGDHKYPVQMPNKADKHAAIHELRVEVGRRKFKFKRKCTNSIWQMKVGMWRDDKHTDFQRSEGLGHLDAIAAAIYFNRAINKNRNPWPANYGLHKETHLITNQSPIRPGTTAHALKSAFGGGRGFR